MVIQDEIWYSESRREKKKILFQFCIASDANIDILMEDSQSQNKTG
jgi:hypothetical protein